MLLADCQAKSYTGNVSGCVRQKSHWGKVADYRAKIAYSGKVSGVCAQHYKHGKSFSVSQAKSHLERVFDYLLGNLSGNLKCLLMSGKFKLLEREGFCLQSQVVGFMLMAYFMHNYIENNSDECLFWASLRRKTF